MKPCVYVLAASVAWMAGFAQPAAAVPALERPVKASGIVLTGFIDRLLQGQTAHRAERSSHRRKQTSRAAQPKASAAEAMPATVPIPLPRPEAGGTHEAPAPGPSAPRPEPRPPADDPASGPKSGAEAPRAGVQGPAEPDSGQGKNGEGDPASRQTPPDRADSQPEMVHEDPEALKQCLSELDSLGARVAKTDPIREGGGCGIEQPVKVEEVLPGVSLGGAVMRCGTALSLAHWLKNTVQPALGIARPGRTVAALVPGTTYACRLRNGAASGMVSEHALGNAFDVAALKFDNGETVEIKPREQDHTIEGAFQKAITAGACLYFSTVLAPGSDAAHETHMHVDIRDRKNGYRICESP